jgi:putative transferase (TIGR04331 family)
VFLVTTANQDYWKKDEKILFLGEWCKTYDQKHIWSNLDYDTLSSHWDEMEDLGQHYTYLESLNEKYLKNLASSLNDSHNEDFSLRYWRIIIGPWLSYFVGIIYDRYLSIKSAIELKKITHTWVPPLKPEPWTPLDTETFLVSACLNDNFNLYLYSQILVKLGVISFEHKEDESFFEELKETDSLSRSKKKLFFIKDILGKISQRIPDRFNQIVFSSSGLSFWNQVKLQISLRQIPYLAPPKIIYSQISNNENLRKTIKLPQATNEFESILNDLIVEQLPTLFLESYSLIRKKSLEAFPKNPKVIFTSYDFSINEGFKFWAATQTEQGGNLILAQHGGGYGITGPLLSENHELEICDKYFTWGWALKDQPKTVPMAGGKLQGVQYNVKSDPNGTILWVTVSWQPYFARIDHINAGFHHEGKYFLRQTCFLDTIFPEVFKLLLMRFSQLKYRGSQEKRLVDIYPSIKTYQGTDSMCSQLRNSRLCIHDYLGTTWLETLSMNFPTVIFWDPKSVNILKSTQPYLDDLRRVGILHDTPESAAKLVNEIYEDPISWWSSPDIQEVREKFCHQFARTSDEWISQWKEELLKIVGGQ